MEKAKASLCAMVSCCFQASHGSNSDDESMYMSQKQMSARNGLFHPNSSTGSSSGPSSGEPNVVLAGYQPPPRWIKDSHIDNCSLCHAQFDLLNRKHHCRGCGYVFCNACASQSDRVIKFGFVEPVRLCHPCAAQARMENTFYEKHLPLLEAGDIFSKYGLLRKRLVQFKFIRAKGFFQYQNIDLESRQYQGEIKAIPLDSITAVREAPTDKDNADLGIILMVGDQENRFDATSALKRKQWIEAIESARNVRNALVASEREKRAKIVEKENEEIKRLASQHQLMQERKASFQEDRLRKRAEKRESLRAKYKLTSTA